jgi:hypothetical protein
MKGKEQEPETLTEEEVNQYLQDNADYINQDFVKFNHRESLETNVGRKLFAAMAENSSIADLHTGSYGDLEEILSEHLTPIETLCLYQYHSEGRSYKEIADSIVVLTLSKGNMVSSEKMNWRQVGNKIVQARAKLKDVLQKTVKSPINKDNA